MYISIYIYVHASTCMQHVNCMSNIGIHTVHGVPFQPFLQVTPHQSFSRCRRTRASHGRRVRSVRSVRAGDHHGGGEEAAAQHDTVNPEQQQLRCFKSV